MNALDELDAEDMSNLIDLCRTNHTWREYVREAIKAVFLHHPRNQCGGNDIECPQDARLQIRFTNEFKQLWMDGTHSFDELQTFLVKTGLDRLNEMDVQVGLTTMKNKGRGRGLRTKEEQQEINWLLGRSTKPPKGVKRRPRMLQELE